MRESTKFGGQDPFQTEYDRFKRNLREATDLRGMHIESGIMDTVIALNMLGFPTAQSCEGHEDGKGSPIPWVTVEQPSEPESHIGKHAAFEKAMDDMGISQKDLFGPDMRQEAADAHWDHMERWFDEVNPPPNPAHEEWMGWAEHMSARLGEWVRDYNSRLTGEMKILMSPSYSGAVTIEAREPDVSQEDIQEWEEYRAKKRLVFSDRFTNRVRQRQACIQGFGAFLLRAVRESKK